MRQKSVHPETPSEQIVKNIRRATRKRHSSEEKIRIVLDGLRGKSSIAELCRRESIAESLYYAWSKEFLEAGKKRLAGDTARAATNGEVKDLRAPPTRRWRLPPPARRGKLLSPSLFTLFTADFADLLASLVFALKQITKFNRISNVHAAGS